MATCAQLQRNFDSDLKKLDTPGIVDTVEYGQVVDDLNSISQQLVAQGCIKISMPTGTWQIDASGYQGTLNNLSFFGSFTGEQGFAIGVSGSVSIDAGFTDGIEMGTWDEANQQLTFTRVIARVNVLQVYTGYLFGNPFGTEPPTIAGTFTTSDLPGRTFGWVSHQ